ncbi:MAG TPA: FtsH protease activity modulator HflK [Rhizomicrobium sp.]|nr:FtsH protease activity modulator HflK [Rhizomicrobium sp.]
MPWTNQGGGSNGSGPTGPRGPWGRGPGSGGSNGGGNAEPPGFEEILRRATTRLRGFLPNGRFTAQSLGVIAAGFFMLWLMSGVYFVSPDEQGVVLRFGAVSALTDPGMRYHLPWPIEVAYTPKVKNENQINIGYQSAEQVEDSQAAGDVTEESHMLTGDENIVDVNFTVYWKIKDAAAYLFNVPKQEATIKAVAESAMREVVGESQIERIQTLDREQMQIRVRDLMQGAVDLYNMGVTITRVRMQKADPPAEVIAAYRDVQAARADQDRKRNEAEAYSNTIIPQARGQAAHIVQDAEAYRLQVIAEASGQAKRFLSVYGEYRKAPEVTRKRIYLENLSQILGPMNKVIVDDAAKGIVPYFQLPSLAKTLPPQPAQSGGAQMMSSPSDGGGP